MLGNPKRFVARILGCARDFGDIAGSRSSCDEDTYVHGVSSSRIRMRISEKLLPMQHSVKDGWNGNG